MSKPETPTSVSRRRSQPATGPLAPPVLDTDLAVSDYIENDTDRDTELSSEDGGSRSRPYCDVSTEHRHTANSDTDPAPE
ncbi:hypothetical protein D8S78_06320 [Natrialba swarupiae]|nr:hypothetical protein [Natrialba swarupiae]